MFYVEQSVDYERIGKLIVHKDIQENLLTQPYDANKLKIEDAIYYVLKHGDTDVGICVILSINNFHFVDIGFIKIARGKVAKLLGLMAKEKFFSSYPNDKLHAMISKKNKSSLLFAKWMGFKIFADDEFNYFLEVSKNGRHN